MPLLSELSNAVKERRSDIGLSQDQLAELSGLSRTTINELETGKLKNLSLSRAERLANAMGLSLTLARPPKNPRGLELAAQAASVSFANNLPEHELEHAVLHGTVPPGFIPQMKALLDEAPLSVLSELVTEMQQKHGVRRNATWQRMRQIARALGCRRGIWLDRD